MGYNTGEGVLDYSYCEEDIVNSAKSNIRGFIQILIGIAIALGLLSLLFSTLGGVFSCLGGCMGCEACIETAACVDDCSCADCNYEELTRNQVEKADARVACDGYDCCGKEGYLACGGCGDCSQCSGYEYDSITIVIDGKRYEEKLIDGATHVSFDWPDGMSSPYYKCLGLFDEDGTLYVSGSGSVKKELEDDLVLYGKFEEVNVGVQYELYFDLSGLGMDDVRIAVTVGGAMPMFPSLPEKEGYEFKGWYKDDYYITNGTNLESTFHLQDFKMSPSSSSRVCTLKPKYEARQHSVQFHVNGSYYATITMPYGTPMSDVYAEFYSQYHDYTKDETFFGWATGSDANPDNEVVGEVLLKKDMTLHAIIHEAIWLSFYYNTDDWYDSNHVDVKFIEGATNIVFDDLTELYIFKQDSMRPGYKFVGWYTTSEPGAYDQAITSIDRLETDSNKYYYAKWEKAIYSLTYWAMDHKAGELKSIAVEEFSMGDEHPLKSDPDDPVGYEFIGWCFDEACLGNVYTGIMPTDVYGNTDLYAKFTPDVYNITLIAPGGSFNSDYTGSNVGGDTISYGSKDNINKAYREGYDFVGWFYGDVATGEGEQLTDGNGDLLEPFTLASLGLAITEANETKINKQFTLFAKWTIKVFEVEFMVDGMAYEYCEVEWGKTIVKTRPNPEKEGYTFQYWTYENGDRYYDTHVIKDGANGVVVDGKVVLIAKFEINKYTVTFVIDGTRSEKKNIAWNTLLGDVEKFLAEPPYSGTPRRRVGWFTTEDFGVQMEADEPVTSHITLYAKYDYAKKFTFYGASGTKEMHYFVGDRETFPTDSKKGYTFDGWCEDSSLNSTPVLENVKIKETTATEYYPKHTTITYMIEYYLSPSDAMAWDTDTYTVEDVKDLIAVGDSEAPTKTGYTFAGWKWNGNQITQLVSMTEDKKLYAIFNANTYDVTLCAEGNNVVKPATYDAGFDFGIPSDKEGYDFIGWSWEYGATETQVVTDNTGKSLAGVVYNMAEDTDAYPVFKVKQYSAFWMDPDGDRIIEQTVIKHFDYVQAPTNPIKEGYTFVGWYQDKACTQEYDFYASTVTGDVTVWAKFTINSYSVTFVVDTGLQYVAENLVYNTSLATAMQNAQSTVDEYVARTDARFVNWLTDDGAIYTEDDVVPARNLTLTAKFHERITVHYELHDGTVYEDSNYYAGDTINEYSYSRKGYTFDGWYTTSNTKQSFPMYADENTSTTILLYARWTANTYRIYYYVDTTGSYTYTETYTTDQTQEYGGLELWTPTAIAGKEFKGWYIDSYGSGTPISALDNYDLSDDEMRCGDIYLYGRWEDIEYSVKFFIDGVEQTAHELKYKNGDGLYSLTWTPTVPVGKTFIGWRIKGTQTIVIDASGNWSNHTTYDWEEDLELEAWFI